MTRREKIADNPFGTMAAAAGIILGGLGVIVGDDVSQGMTNTLRATATVVAHLWGVELATGGILKLLGMFRGRPDIETLGLWLLCGGFAFYCLTVVAGLGHGGLAAGTVSAALAIGCVLKSRLIRRQAQHLLDPADPPEAG